MKRLFLLTCALCILVFSNFSQSTIELTFTAESNGEYIPIDSIFIENITQGGDTTLYTPDTVLVMEFVSGIDKPEIYGENTFFVSQNYPNPFQNNTVVDLRLKDKDDIKITIRDVLGKELLCYTKTLNHGTHSFVFYPGKERCYLLTVTGNHASRTIKMLNTKCNTAFEGKCKIVYIGNGDYEIDSKSQNVINDFAFSFGDELKYTAYANGGSSSITDTPENDQIYTFQIAGMPCPDALTVTDIDGNVYNTVLIGNQCWMKENLKTITYNNGIPIENLTDSSSWNDYYTPGYVWYDNDIYWKDIYGALYNWNATNDTNGLCPTGWHLPTHDEWTTFTDFIGGTSAPYGNELKSCMQLNSPLEGDCNTAEHPRWDEGSSDFGTDDYGFSGLPGGWRDVYGGFSDYGRYSIWWSASEIGYSVWHQGLYFNNGAINVTYSAKRNGFSVRCLKD